MYYKTNTLGKSSKQSLGNFNSLGQINNIQKVPLFQRKVFYIRGDLSNFHFDRSIYSYSSREKKGYTNTVKSHQIIQFCLKTEKITETLVFSEKDKFVKMYHLFSVQGYN